MFLLWHPSLTAINLSYTFPILETSATALCGTTGTIIYTSYIYIYIYYTFPILETSATALCGTTGTIIYTSYIYIYIYIHSNIHMKQYTRVGRKFPTSSSKWWRIHGIQSKKQVCSTSPVGRFFSRGVIKKWSSSPHRNKFRENNIENPTSAF